MIGSGDLGMGVSIYLHDDFSQAAFKAGQSVDQLENRFEKAAQGIDAGLSKLQTGIGGLISAAAVVAPFVIAIGMSASLSDALADVTKTTGIAGDQLQELRTNLEGIDTRTGVEGLLEMAKAGGSMGIAQNDIAGFTESVDKLNVALGDQFSSPEELARGLTKLRNVMTDMQSDDVGADLLHIGNALNYMGANAAATEADIFNIANRMAGLGGELGMTSGDIFGVSTALSEMGVSAEVAGTNFPLILSRIAKDADKFAAIAGMGIEEFKTLVDTDIIKAFETVAKGASETAPTATKMATLLDGVGLAGGRVAEVFLKAGSAGDLMSKRIAEANTQLLGTDSIMGEFNAKNTTFAAVLEKTQKQLGIIMTRVGDALAPIIQSLAEGFIVILNGITSIISSPFGKWLTVITAGLAGVFAAGMAVTAIQSALIPGFIALAGATWTALAPLLPFIAIGAAVVGAFYGIYKAIDSGNENMQKFGLIASVALGPIGMLVGGIIAVKKGWEEFTKVLEGGEIAKGGVLGFLQKIGGVVQGVVEVWKSWNGETFTFSARMNEVLSNMGILDFVVSLGTWVVRIKEFLGGMVDGFKSVGDTVGRSFSRFGAVLDPLWESISNLVGLFFDLDGGMMKAFGSTNAWMEAGKLLGQFLTTGLKIAIELITMSLTGLIGVVTGVIDAFVWLWNSIKALWNGDMTWSEFGAQMVMGIWEGIKGAWEWLKDGFFGLLSALPGGDKIVAWLTGDDPNAASTDPNKITTEGEKTTDGVLRGVNDKVAKNKAIEVNSDPTVIDNTVTKTESITLVTELDGDKIYDKMVEKDKLADARSGG